MVQTRRTILQYAASGSSLFFVGCFEDDPDHRRGAIIHAYRIESPPPDASVVDFSGGDHSENPLLRDLVEMVLNETMEIPRRYERQDHTEISRGTIERDSVEYPYIWFESAEFSREVETAVETLQTLPSYESADDEFRSGIHVQYGGEYIQFQYDIRFSTPG